MVYINNERGEIVNGMVGNDTKDYDTLKRAITALEREAGLRLRIVGKEVEAENFRVDAWVQLEPGHTDFAVEIKKWAQHTNLGALIHQVKNLPGQGLLVADYINPMMADRLREQGVQFIDEAGNAFINQPLIYVFVKGLRNQAGVAITQQKGTANRAFEPTGLAVIYAFLINPDLVNAPYREIAQVTGAALGTVGWVLKGLKNAGFMLDKGKTKGRRLVHHKRLLDRWVELWPEKLKPKQFIGDFTMDDPDWWKIFDIEAYDGYWGGEVAAAKYTGQLKPAVITVYVPEHTRPQLLRDARLRKANPLAAAINWRVTFYRPFWHRDLDAMDCNHEAGLVHPILAYADLIATADPRNLEVAQRLYDDRIAHYIRPD